MHARHLPTRINTLTHMTSTTHTPAHEASRKPPRSATPRSGSEYTTPGASPRATADGWPLATCPAPPHSVTSSGGLFFDSLPLMTLGSMSPAFLARLIMTESEPTLGAAIGSLAPALAGVIIAYGESATS